MKKTLVYVGIRDWGPKGHPRKTHVFKDVTSNEGKELGFEKLFGKARLIGEQVEVEVGENGTTYTLNEYQGAWPNKDDIRGWQLLDDAARAAIVASTAATAPLREDLVKSTLVPIRDIYRKATPAMQSAILAQVIAVITNSR